MPIKGFGIGFENLRAVLLEVIELTTGELAKRASHSPGEGEILSASMRRRGWLLAVPL
jgi:hypothetical protein